MELKKNSKVDVGRNSSLYFAIGLNIMLFITWSAFEYKSYDSVDVAIDVLELEETLEEDIPITNLDTPPPPPPPPSAPEIINVVEDVAEIEETIIESTETSQEEKIETIVDIDDVYVEEVEEDIKVPFSVIENVPVYPGCKGNNAELKECFETKIIEHIKKNYKYPEVAMELGIHGKVFVLFEIDSKGKVANIRTRGPDKILEKEANRIISLLPKMVPGKQRGKPVRVPYGIPINFKYEY